MTTPMEFLICAACSKPFVRSWKRQKYCTTECALYSRIEQRGPNECWPWTGGRNNHGYGKLSLNQKRTYAHRLALRLSGVGVPPDADVMHSCDNPPCCNPAHLSIGDAKANSADMKRKGRGVNPPRGTGETHSQVKLTAEIAEQIKAAFAQGLARRKVGRRFGISGSYARRIYNGTTCW